MSENASSKEAQKGKPNQLSEGEEDHFIERGRCDDEVTFFFDDEKKLYVSRNFLCYASPVFVAMFTSDFKEKTSGVVEMKEKRYDDVLEFLLTLHPDVQKPITEENVYTILSLAEEYQAKRSIKVCRLVLSEKLQTDVIKVLTDTDTATAEYDRTEAALACFKVLSTALLYGYDEIQENALNAISRFGSSVYRKESIFFQQSFQQSRSYSVPSKRLFTAGSSWYCTVEMSEKINTKRKECKDSFNALPDCIKVQILLKRLDITDEVKSK